MPDCNGHREWVGRAGRRGIVLEVQPDPHDLQRFKYRTDNLPRLRMFSLVHGNESLNSL